MAGRLLGEGMAGWADEVLDRMIAPYNVTGRPDVAAHVLRMMRGTSPRAPPPRCAGAPGARTTAPCSPPSACPP